MMNWKVCATPPASSYRGTAPIAAMTTGFPDGPVRRRRPSSAGNGCRFNRSTQQLDGIVQPVYRSLVSCAGVH